MHEERKETMIKNIKEYCSKFKQYNCYMIDTDLLDDNTILMLEDVYYITGLITRNDNILFRRMLDGIAIRQQIEKGTRKEFL